MDDLILDDVKNILGPMLGDDFDSQILGLIGIALLPLTQVGCLKDYDGAITNDMSWQEIVELPPYDGEREFLGNTLPAIKQYIALNVRILFDPPVSGVIEFMKSKCDELLWRIEAAYEYKR